MKKNGLTLKLFLLIVSTDIGDSVAQLLMKKGVMETGIGSVDFSNVLNFIAGNVCSPLVWLGIIIYALTFFAWIVVLSQVDLSVALPVGSTSYILTPLMAMVFLGEILNPLRWVGIFLIIAGIYFASKSTPQTFEASSNR